MYADDTSLCHQSSNMTQLIEAINLDLKELDTWLQGNKLSLNVVKTPSMLLSTKQRKNTFKSRNETYHLKIRGNELQDATKSKYLGVVIDCSLDWREQIQSISSKVSRAIGFLTYAHSFLPMETVIALYRGIVEPHFRYCFSVCGCAGKTEVNQLQKLQNRAARIVTGSRFDAPSGPIIEGLGWKTIEELIESETQTMVYKSLNELAPRYLSGLFIRNSQFSFYNLRSTEADLWLPKRE